MSARGSRRGASVFDTTCDAQEHVPAFVLELPWDMRATSRAHAALLRLLGDIAPERRAVASLLMDAPIDSAMPRAGNHQCLRVWRLQGRVDLEMHTTAPAFVRDPSRTTLDRLAAHREYDATACCVRVAVRTTLGGSSRGG